MKEEDANIWPLTAALHACVQSSQQPPPSGLGHCALA